MSCISHENCPQTLKILNNSQEGYEIFERDEFTEHSNVRAELPRSFQGISAEFLDDVDKLIAKGKNPRQIIVALLIKCGKDESKKKRVPTKDKITAHRIKRRRTPLFGFKTFNDLNEFALPKLVDSKEKFDAIEDWDQLIVINIFVMKVNIKNPDTGKRACTETMGFVYTTKRQMEQYRDYMLAMLALQYIFILALSIDGTYRIAKDWTLIDGGFLTTHFEGGTCYGNEYVQSIFCVMYVFCLVECREAYVQYIQAMRLVLPLFYPELFPDAEKLKCQLVIMDRSNAIRNAAVEVLGPDVDILNDVVHFDRKVRQGFYNVYFSNDASTVGSIPSSHQPETRF